MPPPRRSSCASPGETRNTRNRRKLGKTWRNGTSVGRTMVVAAGSKVQNFCHVATYVAELGVVLISSESRANKVLGDLTRGSWRWAAFQTILRHALLGSPNERAYAQKATPCIAHHRVHTSFTSLANSLAYSSLSLSFSPFFSPARSLTRHYSPRHYHWLFGRLRSSIRIMPTRFYLSLRPTKRAGNVAATGLSSPSTLTTLYRAVQCLLWSWVSSHWISRFFRPLLLD